MNEADIVDTAIECYAYYEIEGREINLVLKQSSFPYWKTRINIYNTIWSAMSYDDMLDMIIDGGEDYMIERIEKAIRNIRKKDDEHHTTESKKQKVSEMHSTVRIDRDIWKEMRKGTRVRGGNS